MKKSLWVIWILLGLMLIPLQVFGSETGYLGIFAETGSFKTAGMPELSPEEQAQMAAIPGMAKMLGAPELNFKVRLWSPGNAPEGATANLAIPRDLMLGPSLNLQIERPERAEVAGKISPDKIKFKIYRYWGSSPVVRPGQPQVINWDGLTPEQKALVEQQNRKSASEISRPDFTQAYWPNSPANGKVSLQARAAGSYQLTTSYTGNVSFEVPQEIKFLPPVELTSPRLSTQPSLEQPLELAWKIIPEVLGYNVTVMGIKGRDTLIIWSCTENLSSQATFMDYLAMDEIKKLVEDKSLVAPQDCKATVPAGIFQECDSVQLIINGYGPAFASEGKPLPRFQTKTTLMAILGGKLLKDMNQMEAPQR